MKHSLCLILIAAILAPALAAICETDEKDCAKETEYSAYVACMQVRSKRSTDCQNENDDSCENGNCNGNDCDNCDCNSCSYGNCQTSCNSCCSSCCNTINSCSNNNCCHKTCHATCKSNSCRSSCKKSCKEYVSVGGKTSSSSTSLTSSTDSKTAIANRALHNITTVIHLNNFINNTNLINIPVNVNSTNHHNITIANQGSSGFTGGIIGGGIIGGGGVTGGGGSVVVQPPNPTDQCCHIVGPRQCVPQEKFPFVRCFHVRKRACGRMCTSPIIHYQKHEICDQDVPQQPCHQQAVYIPQPQPRCAHYPNWPYVACGGAARQESCDGCYSHYGDKTAQQTRCSPYCYDDGYGAGPYYRQGPFYRPGYAHVPSCLQTGLCGAEGFDYGYGGGYGYGYGGVPVGLPQGGVGYPIGSYGDGPFIEDDGKPWINGSQYSYTTYIESNLGPDANFRNISKEPSIEALYEAPRSVRFAEITIRKASDEEEDNVTEPQPEQEVDKEKSGETTTENITN